MKDSLDLLKEVHFTTTGVEQGHGSTAAMHKGHPRLGSEQLCGRSYLHTCKLLVQLPAESSTSRLLKQAEALKSKVPERVGGRHIFWKELRREAAQELPPGQKLSKATSVALFAQHGSLWKQLPSEVQAEHNRSASRHAVESRKALEDEIAGLQAYSVFFQSLTEHKQFRSHSLVLLNDILQCSPL